MQINSERNTSIMFFMKPDDHCHPVGIWKPDGLCCQHIFQLTALLFRARHGQQRQRTKEVAIASVMAQRSNQALKILQHQKICGFTSGTPTNKLYFLIFLMDSPSSSSPIGKINLQQIPGYKSIEKFETYTLTWKHFPNDVLSAFCNH